MTDPTELRELDRRVAEAKGWTNLCQNALGAWLGTHWWRGMEVEQVLPHYSTDTGLAMTLFEEMAAAHLVPAMYGHDGEFQVYLATESWGLEAESCDTIARGRRALLVGVGGGQE